MIPIVNNNSATVKYTIIIVGICALIITGSVMSSVYMSILESNYDEGNEITKYDCGNENYTVRYNSYKSNLAQREKLVMMKFYDGVKQRPVTVTNAKGYVDAYFGKFRVMHEEINACGEQKVSMPLNLGDISITEMACPNGPNEQPNVKLSVIVPSIAPPGSYTFKYYSKLENGDDYFCVGASFNL